MWVFWTPITFAVLGWLIYSWIVELKTKYEHTSLSVVFMILLVILSATLGWRFVGQLAPAWDFLPRLILSLGVTLALFTLLSFFVISLWRAFLTREYDQKILELEDEEDVLLRKIEVIRWETARSATSSRYEQPQEKNQNTDDEATKLRTIVESWEHGSGAARIRSLKVLEWREEILKKSSEEISQDIQRLSHETHSEEELQKLEQSRVKIALCRLELLRRAKENNDESEDSRISFCQEDYDERDIRIRLHELHKEIQVAKEKRQEFLSNKIKLSGGMRH
jgi:hypothetical protein